MDGLNAAQSIRASNPLIDTLPIDRGDGLFTFATIFMLLVAITSPAPAKPHRLDERCAVAPITSFLPALAGAPGITNQARQDQPFRHAHTEGQFVLIAGTTQL